MAPNHPCQFAPKPGWMAPSPLQTGFEDRNCQAEPNRKVPRISEKPTTMTAPAPLPQRRCHPSRAIQYILLDSCRNIPASHILASMDSYRAHRGSASCHPINHVPSTAVSSCSLHPSYLPMFPILHRKPAQGSGHSLDARKRLPVFLQLCGDDVSTTAPRDAHLQTLSHERKGHPNAKALREGKRGQRMKKMAGCTLSDKA
ncbi:uncharacterized protein LOC107322379 isoform X1 [Coturnix japonica]|uniref:uncharacterized protein LOC107322379 isoform X1 n=1 Tax=Coturnix japonica TaxID=93934 RepID=UPI0007773495|nr:uncharacterized protein LOC107322379 isoform X1 [Coturnix japonica]